MAKKSDLAERLEKASKAPEPVIVAETSTAAVVDAVVKPEAKVNGLAAARAARAANRNPNESKHDKLIRLSNYRVTKACKAISAVGNLATYKPTPAEIEKILLALGESCARVSNRLNGIRNEVLTFTLN